VVEMGGEIVRACCTKYDVLHVWETERRSKVVTTLVWCRKVSG
jgi:hypothetical protein